MTTLSRWTALATAFGAGVGITLIAALWIQSARNESGAALAEREEPKVLYWFDPMYPDKRFEQPGKSPFMDMQLVPKYANDVTDSEGTVRIDSRLAQNLGVRTGTAVRGSFDAPVRATVTLAFDESTTSVVQARVDGIVERLIIRTPLSNVKRGERLLILIAPAWTAAQEEYLALRDTKLQSLTDVRDAARARLSLLGMTETQIRSIEQTGRAQTRITVLAPHDGVVSELSVREGETVMAGAPLMRLNGTSMVWAHAAIAEARIGQIHPGARTQISLAALPGETFAGQVTALLPTIDPVSRTRTARIVLDNRAGRFTAGMIGEATISVLSATDVVWVPSEAIITTGKREVIIVETGEGNYRAQEVRVGTEAEGRSEILAGLAAGDRVVLSGQFLIDSEASLTGTLARLGRDTDLQVTDPSVHHEHSGTTVRPEPQR